MAGPLASKVVIVTGGATGIGRALGAPPEGALPGPAPNPTGRVFSPAEIASFVAFLLSDDSAFITGAALAITAAPPLSDQYRGR